MFPFVAYRANSMHNGQLQTYVAPDEQLPGLYWIKTEPFDGGKSFWYQTGHPDLKCYKEPKELIWKDPPDNWSPSEQYAGKFQNPTTKSAIWKYFELKLGNNCDGNDGKGETPDDWRRRCFAYSWEIVPGDHETKTQLFLG